MTFSVEVEEGGWITKCQGGRVGEKVCVLVVGFVPQNDEGKFEFKKVQHRTYK